MQEFSKSKKRTTNEVGLFPLSDRKTQYFPTDFRTFLTAKAYVFSYKSSCARVYACVCMRASERASERVRVAQRMPMRAHLCVRVYVHAGKKPKKWDAIFQMAPPPISKKSVFKTRMFTSALYITQTIFISIFVKTLL